MLKRREGFTLIELLIVVVIIGILAAIAIPKFGATREKAYYSAMKSDLRNLQSSQEMYYASGGYEYLQAGQATSAAPITELDNFTASQGVTVDLAAGGASAAEGWLATATHTALPGASCEVYVGEATGTVASGPGVVACEDAAGAAQ